MKPTTAFVVSSWLVSVLHVVRAQDEGFLIAETHKTVRPALPRVVQAMQAAVQESGAVGAIPVCKEIAPLVMLPGRYVGC